MQPFSLKVNSTAIYTHTIIIYICMYIYTQYTYTQLYIHNIHTNIYMHTHTHEDTILVPFSRAGKMVQ